jgi:Zn-dependent protease with chaperone function
MTAVIAHELGHFRGEDTVYSLKFAPVYRGLGDALQIVNAEEDDGASGLAKVPAFAMLMVMYEMFSRNESAISRIREFEADKTATEVAPALALAAALMKVSLYGQLWERARSDNLKRLERGKISRNLSKIFADSAQFDIEEEALPKIMGLILDTRVSHPTDSHPTIAARLEALGVKPSSIDKEMLLVTSESAIHLIDRALNIEEELTMLEHRLMVALGHVELPDEGEKQTPSDALLRASFFRRCYDYRR